MGSGSSCSRSAAPVDHRLRPSPFASQSRDLDHIPGPIARRSRAFQAPLPTEGDTKAKGRKRFLDDEMAAPHPGGLAGAGEGLGPVAFRHLIGPSARRSPLPHEMNKNACRSRSERGSSCDQCLKITHLLTFDCPRAEPSPVACWMIAKRRIRSHVKRLSSRWHSPARHPASERSRLHHVRHGFCVLPSATGVCHIACSAPPHRRSVHLTAPGSAASTGL